MAIDEDRVKQLSADYEALKARHDALVNELREVQQRMGEIMLQIIDVTRE